MIELIQEYAGQFSGMRFDNAVINLEEVKETSNGKSFHFLAENGSPDLRNGDPVYRFSHYIDNSILLHAFSNKTDVEIAMEIVTLLSQPDA